MAFEGNLETMAVADVLQWAANGRLTGTLRISRGEITKMIYIRKGVIVSCTSTDPREFLGHFLVSKGAISESDLQEAVIDQDRFSGLLGQILIQRGAITAAELDKMLRIKAEEAIFDLFTWKDGQFLFTDGEMPVFELVPISLGVQGLVLEGMRRLDEWERILDVIPSELCVPVAVRQLVDPDDDIDLGTRSVLESVDDDRSIEDICLHTHSSEFYVCEILFRQHRKGKLKFVRPRSGSRQRASAEGMSGDSLVQVARELLDDGELERSVRYLQAASSLEPHNHQLRDAATEVERGVRARLEDQGVTRNSVPVLEIGADELAKLDLEPSEGFILSRIDGRSPLEAIVKISPLPEIESLLVVWKLVRGGQVGLK
ncbi:MAG: DUF4388 domain-containing protein [Candidatus Sulfomarinibacteraceae bacterium]